MNGLLSAYGHDSLVSGLEMLQELDSQYRANDASSRHVNWWRDFSVNTVAFKSRNELRGLDAPLERRINEPSLLATGIKMGRRLFPQKLSEPSIIAYELSTRHEFGTQYAPLLCEDKMLTVFQKLRGGERVGDAEFRLSVIQHLQEDFEGPRISSVNLGLTPIVREIDLFADIVGRRIDFLTGQTPN